MSKDDGDNKKHPTADDVKKAAMQQVEDNANEAWIDFMVDCVWDVCRSKLYFTADDVFDRYEEMPDPKPTTHEPRAMGPVMNRAAKEGLCIKANVPGLPSRRRSLHASPRTVWKSQIFEAEV